MLERYLLVSQNFAYKMVTDIYVFTSHMKNRILSKTYCTLVITIDFYVSQFVKSQLLNESSKINGLFGTLCHGHVLSLRCRQSYGTLLLGIPGNCTPVQQEDESRERSTVFSTISSICIYVSTNSCFPMFLVVAIIKLSKLTYDKCDIGARCHCQVSESSYKLTIRHKQQGRVTSFPKTKEESEQDVRLRKQNMKLSNLNRAIEQALAEIDQRQPKSRYEYLLKKITALWGPIQDLHEELVVYQFGEDQYFTNNIVWEAEAKFESIIFQLEEKIQEVSPVMSKPNIKLPQIQLPIFKGGYENWTTFHDLFRKVIYENTSISDVEKMQYLKTDVKDEAARLIQHLQITDGNYQAAWDLLTKRYQNSRLMITKLVDQILDVPQIHHESSQRLKQLHDVVRDCLEAINNLGIDTEPWGPLISRIISRKWDHETNKLYEQRVLLKYSLYFQ
ncbi:hypothetical protein TcasGA2_TC010296 [Tribolium castaneum]|uniref:Uncharacterized protein n=1 Tax=Tribolium castaneum TaxID=7070 RepID=D7EJK8_TRICA|nr:hypothetical protein TcasGA2_TC010296 [Tribolium castaneum]